MKSSKRMFVAVLTLCLAFTMALASVTVNAATKKPKKITLKTTASTVDIKGKVRVTVKSVSPKGASKSVKYKSSNKKVATVSSSGYVTGKKKGTVKITVTSKKNKKAKKTIKITVKDLKASSVTLNQKSWTAAPNMKTTIKATVKGSAGFYNQGVTWKSSNTAVATVDSKGNVTAKKAGSATITATEKGGSKKATCAVTVRDAGSSTPTVDTEKKSVTIDAVVMKPDTKSMHYVVSTKGNQAANATMVTTVSTTDFEKAMSDISATPWNSDKKVTDAEKKAVGNTIYDLVNGKVDGTKATGNANYTKVKVTVSWDGGSKTMQESLKDATNGENFSMIYANVANDANAQFGCITCNTSCYSGMVANELESTKNPFTPQNLPEAGTKVKITYTVDDTNYISPSELASNMSDYVILDARKEADYNKNCIKGAVSADVDGAVSNPTDESKATAKANVQAVVEKYGTDKKYAVICYSGNRYAAVATSYLKELGVSSDNIVTLGNSKGRNSSQGGMKAWLAYGGDLQNYKYCNASDVTNVLKESYSVIIDTRATADYNEKHIPGAILADVSKDSAKDDVAAIVDKYGKGKSYYVICYTGNSKARKGTALLMSAGVDTANILTLGGDDRTRSDEGGMKAWNAKYPHIVVSGDVTTSGDYHFNNAITADDLKEVVSDTPIKCPLTLMDVRAAKDYVSGHIDGAISTPSDDSDAIKSAINPNALYVLICYSGNSKADAARNVMVNDLGVSEDRIIVLTGGMKAWTGDTVSSYHYVNAKTTYNNLENPDYVVLDVRKAADYKAGHIPGAVSADVDGAVTNATDETKATAQANVQAVVDKYGKDKKYIVICYSGNRYAQAGTACLLDAGVNNDNIFTLGGKDSTQSSEGGMKAWTATYKDYTVAEHTSSKGKYFQNSITVDQLKADLSGSELYTVLDVRAATDYEAGTIDGAISAPSDDASALKSAVDGNPNGLYVLVCYTGNSKADAARNILVNSFDVPEDRVIVLQGGMEAWNDANGTSN